MTTEADQLRRQIEQTQRGLSADVNALTEKVTPGRIVQRRMSRARRAMTSAKDRVMGTTSGGTTAATERMSAARSSMAGGLSSASDSVSSMAGTVAEAPQAIRRSTEGNPLAAGLIAFGAGWLTSSLLPPTKREQQLANQAKEYAQPLADQAGEMAQQVKEGMREPAQQAVESVRSAADEARSTVADQTKLATQDVRGQVQQSTEQVRDQTQRW